MTWRASASRTSRWRFSSFTWLTRGIITSGCTFTPSRVTAQAASKTARTCIRVSSGIMIPSRTPRVPSIGLASCRASTRASRPSTSAMSAGHRAALGLRRP